MTNGVAIQIDLERIAVFDKERMLAYLKETGAEVQVEQGSSEEAYVNFNCWTDGDVLPIWQHVQRYFVDQPAIKIAAIVCCTGKHGWDDYLLLHGAAEGETLDLLET